MPNIYGRWIDLAADLKIMSRQQPPETIAQLLRRMESASRSIDKLCRRHFYAETSSREYDVDGSELLLPNEDLLSVSALLHDTAGDATFATTLTESYTADFVLRPDNETRKWLIKFASTMGRVRVTGVRGYSNDTEDTGRTVSGTLGVSDTTLTLDAQGDIVAGETLVIGTQQLYVQEQLTATTLKVQRGLNGTTAASASNGTAIYRRSYPAPVVEAVMFYAARSWRSLQSGGDRPGATLFAPQATGGGERGILAALEPYSRVGLG